MTKIKLAASVILSRGTGSDTEVYLCLRAAELKFFGGYWVFPGGNLDKNLDYISEDDPLDVALYRCAVRELLEEVNVLSSTLGQQFSADKKDALKLGIKDSPQDWREFISEFDSEFPHFDSVFRITTPPFIPVRFDTQFLHVRMRTDESPAVDNYELVDGCFIKAADAISAWQQGKMDIAPPVLFQLRLIAEHGMDALAEHAGRAAVKLEQGGLHQAYFSPGIFMAPLQTPTLPPATTTNTLIVGTDRLYVIDPATPDKNEQMRLISHMEELISQGKHFEAILLTHHHSDHVGAVNALSRHFRLPVRAHEECFKRIDPGFIKGDALNEGDRLELGIAPDGSDDWHLKVLHTPGHAVDHLCYLESRYHAAIIGDMMSTLSTIVIDPPEGHMRTYLEQLQRLLQHPISTVYPSHGPPRRDGAALIRQFIEHRKEREEEILDALSTSAKSIEELLVEVYKDIPEQAYPVASRSLLAGLIKLEEDAVACQADDGWRLAKP